MPIISNGIASFSCKEKARDGGISIRTFKKRAKTGSRYSNKKRKIPSPKDEKRKCEGLTFYRNTNTNNKKEQGGASKHNIERSWHWSKHHFRRLCTCYCTSIRKGSNRTWGETQIKSSKEKSNKEIENKLRLELKEQIRWKFRGISPREEESRKRLRERESEKFRD